MDKQSKPQQLSAEARQAAIDAIDVEHLKKIEAIESSGIPVDSEWMLLAEFALLYGWEAYKDARDDNISGVEMITLINAGRKLKTLEKYNMAQAVYIGAGSVQAKEPSKAFGKMTKDMIKDMKVDDE